MARRTHHLHAIRHVDPESRSDNLHGIAWCGERGVTLLSKMPEGEDPKAYSRRIADCPKCSAMIGKARLKQLAGRVELVKDDENAKGRGYYRTAWLVKIDGTPIAHVVMKTGWGNPWELKDLWDPDKPVSYTGFGSTISDTPRRYDHVPAHKLVQRVHGASKEMMACAALRLFEAGHLKTVEQRRAIEAERKAQQEEDARQRKIDEERYQEERKAWYARREERKQLALDGLEIALGRALTNSEIAGIQAAMDIINGKDVQ